MGGMMTISFPLPGSILTTGGQKLCPANRQRQFTSMINPKVSTDVRGKRPAGIFCAKLHSQRC
jgi:hypothetical protein